MVKSRENVGKLGKNRKKSGNRSKKIENIKKIHRNVAHFEPYD